MKMVDIIAKKRNGNINTNEEINFLIDGVTDGSIPDYQTSAWLMAAYLKGLNFDEAASLTEAMAKSGDILDLSVIGDCVVDKHSTGGVGDKTTLILIPLLAAAGIPVAKFSGRGLGHTGGTIDKLDSISGFNTSLAIEDFLAQVKSIGGAITGQTAKITPADGKLYALRDVIATVDSIPLIAASVVSKKIASGANVIVLDVKYGSGAFMKTKEDAEELSRTMVEIGKRLNRKITAVITSMEEPLGKAVGNAVEVAESIETLKNNGPKDLTDLTLSLGAISLVDAGKTSSIEEGVKVLSKHLEDGSAFDKFKEIVKAQNGDVEQITNTEKLPNAKYQIEFKAEKSGFVSKSEAISIAKACKLLGAGRDKKEDSIDHSVGIILNKKNGEQVHKGELLATIYSNSKELGEESINYLNTAFEISDTTPEVEPIIYKIIK